MTTKLQSVDLERLGIGEETKGNTCISLGGENRIYFVGGEMGRNWDT